MTFYSGRQRGNFHAVERDLRKAAVGCVYRFPPGVADAVEDARERDADQLLRPKFIERAAVAHVAIRDLVNIARPQDGLFFVDELFSVNLPQVVHGNFFRSWNPLRTSSARRTKSW